MLPALVDKATPNGELPADGKLNIGKLAGVVSVLTRLFAKNPPA